MTKTLNKQLQKYYKRIKMILCCSNKEKKEILNSLKTNIESYIDERPTATFEDILKHFGTPEEIAEQNFEKTEVIKMFAKISVLIAIIAIVCTVLVIAFALLVVLFVSNIEVNGSYSLVEFIPTLSALL